MWSFSGPLQLLVSVSFSLFLFVFFLISELEKERKTAVAGYLLYRRKVELKAARPLRQKRENLMILHISFTSFWQDSPARSPLNCKQQRKSLRSISVFYFISLFLEEILKIFQLGKWGKKNILIVFYYYFHLLEFIWHGGRVQFAETRLGNVPRVPSSLKISRVWRVKEKERKWKATAAELRDKLPTTERTGILACGPLAQLGGLDTKKSYFQLSM